MISNYPTPTMEGSEGVEQELDRSAFIPGDVSGLVVADGDLCHLCVAQLCVTFPTVAAS